MKLLNQQIQFTESHPGEDFVLVTIKNTQGSTYKKAGAIKVVASDGSSSGLISGGCLEADIVSKALNLSSHSEIHEFDTSADNDRLLGSTIGCQGTLLLEFENLTRQNLLLRLREFQSRQKITVHIIGAGPDLDPLREILLTTGWSHRFYTADTELLKQRQTLHWPVHPVTQPKMDWILENPKRSAVLLMSHSYPQDLDVLSQLADSGVGYIGILGPEKRRLQMFEDLESMYQIPESAFSETIIEGPMGLGGLGKGELAIALAISGRLQQVFFGEQQ